MAGGRTPLAFCDCLVLRTERSVLLGILFSERRMAPPVVHAGPRCGQCVPAIRLLSTSAENPAAAGLLQRSATTGLYLGNSFRGCDGAVGARDLQARAIALSDAVVRRLRRRARSPSGGSLPVRPVC